MTYDEMRRAYIAAYADDNHEAMCDLEMRLEDVYGMSTDEIEALVEEVR